MQGQEMNQAVQPPCQPEIPPETPPPAPRHDLPTPETWRQRFRAVHCLEAKGLQEVFSRLRELAQRWLEPQHHSKEQMLELGVLEQFLAILPREMESWQWGHGVETCAEAATLAEGFLVGQEEDETLQWKSFHAGHGCCSPHPNVLGGWARHTDRRLEESGEIENLGPWDKSSDIPREDAPPPREPVSVHWPRSPVPASPLSPIRGWCRCRGNETPQWPPAGSGAANPGLCPAAESPGTEETGEVSADNSCSGWCPRRGPSPGAGSDVV
ncbi:zinc finger protein 232-like [Alligator sinensis]|uniref:Zinc finger protein 232-like n=1 Tax=Alligator sinensis TaxID=38654 RepID=A0A3Q0FW44_ALLSI|nr:zinc finger protein 232-like [Alligator sinensis]